MKTFENWEIQDLRNTFHIYSVENLPTLSTWIETKQTITETENAWLEDLRKDLVLLNEDWNEDELKMHFIAPLLHLVHYGRKDTYNAFYQRGISAKIGEVEMSGIVDMIVAKGWEKPMNPYFFLHEYKQEQGGKGDAKAQLLSAMLVAQEINGNEKPMFGLYLVGSSWRFVVLMGKEYALKRYDATEQDDLQQIFRMLKWIKQYIHDDLHIK
jgi:hypothetical protein